MENNSLWKSNIFLSFLVGMGGIVSSVPSILLASYISSIWKRIPEKAWVIIFTTIFTLIINWIKKEVKNRYFFEVTFLINENSRAFERRQIDLNDKSFESKGICKIYCKISLTGKTKERDLLIKLDPGVDLNFNQSNKIKDKRAKFAGELSESNGEKGVIYHIPKSPKAGRTISYNFDLYLEKDEIKIDFEKIFTISLQKNKWYENIFTNVNYNNINAKVEGEIND